MRGRVAAQVQSMGALRAQHTGVRSTQHAACTAEQVRKSALCVRAQLHTCGHAFLRTAEHARERQARASGGGKRGVQA